MEHIVIIGNGIAGITAARHVRKLSNYRITVISAETDYFFSRTALMYIYMGHMKFEHTKPYEDFFWDKNRIELIRAYVKQVNTADKKLLLDTGIEISYDKLVIASGSIPNKGDWPGHHLEGVQGLVSIGDLENMEKHTAGIKRAVVVGGGLIGIEMVEMLRSRGIHVTFIVREFEFWSSVLPPDESKMITAHMQNDHHVDLRLGTSIKEIKGNPGGRVTSVITENNEVIPCEFAGITIGVRPRIHFLQDSPIKTGKGILVNEYFETNINDVYAIGDCAEFENALSGRPKIEQIWYTGRMHGETIARTLTGSRTPYIPVNFFNSAKLFDVEYQVYTRQVKLDERLENIFFKSADNKKSIRVFYDPESYVFEGVSLLGIRYRHEVCDRWLREKRNMDHVLAHLSDANFDPEFFDQYEKILVDEYNRKTGKNIQLKKKSWQRILGWTR